MIYKVIEDTEIKHKDFHKKVKTEFDLDYKFLNKNKKTGDTSIYEMDRKNYKTLPVIDNNYMNLLAELEAINYPIQLEMKKDREFVQFFDFENWIETWKEKARQIINKYDKDENVADIVNKYFRIIKNKELFGNNRLNKEHFWSLFFFKPYLDSSNKPDVGTSYNWNIKSIGGLKCFGRTKLLDSKPGFGIFSFQSNQVISNDIIEKLKMITNKNINWEEQKIDLVIESHSNYIEGRNYLRSSQFSLEIEGVISYSENITIKVK